MVSEKEEKIQKDNVEAETQEKTGESSMIDKNRILFNKYIGQGNKFLNYEDVKDAIIKAARNQRGSMDKEKNND